MGELIWAPNLVPESDRHQLDSYLRFAGTCCVRSGGCSIEQALEVLYACKGSIKLATRTLLTSTIQYAQSRWTLDEVHEFERLIMSYGKNFYKISNDLKSKSVKECVQFYYSWKKSSYRRNLSPVSSLEASTSSLTATPASSSSTSDDSRDSGRLSASISDDHSLLSTHTPLSLHQQQQQLEQHQHYVQLQQQRQQCTPSINKQLLKQQQQQPDCFPCKVCGRVFEKIKSRSAHMKRHKNER